MLAAGINRTDFRGSLVDRPVPSLPGLHLCRISPADPAEAADPITAISSRPSARGDLSPPLEISLPDSRRSRVAGWVDQRQSRTSASRRVGCRRPDFFTNRVSSFSLTWHRFHFLCHPTEVLKMRLSHHHERVSIAPPNAGFEACEKCRSHHHPPRLSHHRHSGGGSSNARLDGVMPLIRGDIQFSYE
ncbi:hypothetical protein R20943_07361 [Paraburkholderia aspalathi]|nr:hypothetical protein R20943_07361 [Paraburkholderia aspalathi]